VFEALNRDFRYQLTCIGGFAPVFIAEKIAGNRLQDRGWHRGLEVSWQVTGIRHDAYAEAHRIPVEEIKSSAEEGFFIHPSCSAAPKDRSLDWVYNPELMRELATSTEQLKTQQ